MESQGYPSKKNPGSGSGDGYIDDIYKYCDRWCAKCRFTSACLSYSRLAEGQNTVNDDAANDITDSYSADELMSREMARELPADEPDGAETGDADNGEYFKDSLSSYAWKVSSGMYNWLHSLADGGGQKRIKLMKTDLSGKSSGLEALDIIDYYLFPAVARLENAVRCSVDSKKQAPWTADSNGLAKTAVLSVERIMEAWAVIIKEYPEHEDCILNFLIGLSRVISKTEKRFPAARVFIRPGLDE